MTSRKPVAEAPAVMATVKLRLGRKSRTSIKLYVEGDGFRGQWERDERPTWEEGRGVRREISYTWTGPDKSDAVLLDVLGLEPMSEPTWEALRELAREGAQVRVDKAKLLAGEHAAMESGVRAMGDWTLNRKPDPFVVALTMKNAAWAERNAKTAKEKAKRQRERNRAARG